MEDVEQSVLCVSCDWLKGTLKLALSTVGRGAVTSWQHLLLGVWWWW